MLGLVTAALRGVTRPGRTDRGLYAGSRIFFGNKISKDKKSPSKSTRTWLPNVQKRKLYSNILGRHVRLTVTARALKCIDKAGGFDNYILHTSERKLDSALALALREEMRRVQASQAPPS